MTVVTAPKGDLFTAATMILIAVPVAEARGQADRPEGLPRRRDVQRRQRRRAPPNVDGDRAVMSQRYLAAPTEEGMS
jgi:hypothetical protein